MGSTLILGKILSHIASNTASVLFTFFFFSWYSHYMYVTPWIVVPPFLHNLFWFLFLGLYSSAVILVQLLRNVIGLKVSLHTDALLNFLNLGENHSE